MRRNRKMSAVTIGLAAMASVATAMGVVAAAAAAPYVPARTGLFATWRGAQSAAGFKLMRPTNAHHLKRNSPISVARCEISKKKANKRLVTASYGLTAAANLTLSQNNSGGPCLKTSKAKRLGKVKVHGATATLIGDCDAPHLPRCSSKRIFMFLTWRSKGIFYQAMSFGEARATLISFARSAVRA